jgi:hypothetical protein
MEVFHMVGNGQGYTKLWNFHAVKIPPKNPTLDKSNNFSLKSQTTTILYSLC